MNPEQFFGISEQHVCVFSSAYADVANGFLINKNIVEPLEALCKAAYRQGFKLALLSGYRNYQRQCEIWDLKNCGERVILDEQGSAILEFSSQQEKLTKISRWSALPGMSRHHWGTDIDIFSAAAIENGYHVQLLEKEFSADGPCAELETWLTQNLQQFSFFRPYQIDSGGIAPEPWHISYQPIASQIQSNITLTNLKNTWKKHPWCGSSWASENAAKLYQIYINN